MLYLSRKISCLSFTQSLNGCLCFDLESCNLMHILLLPTHVTFHCSLRLAPWCFASTLVSDVTRSRSTLCALQGVMKPLYLCGLRLALRQHFTSSHHWLTHWQCTTVLALFPGLPRLQFLFAWSVQKQYAKTQSCAQAIHTPGGECLVPRPSTHPVENVLCPGHPHTRWRTSCAQAIHTPGGECLVPRPSTHPVENVWWFDLSFW